MRRIKSSLFVACLLGFVYSGIAVGQVVMPVEIKDPDLRALQQENMEDLKRLGSDVLSLPTEYMFYLSRRLDLDEQQQKVSDQRSIRFDRYKSRTVLEVTGNYYAAYSVEKMSPEQRAKETFDKIVIPILRLEVARFQSNSSVQGYAFEISHHVVGKVMNVPVEHPENLVAVFPRDAAIRLVAAKEDSVKQAALLSSEIYLNAQPVTIWLKDAGPQLAKQDASDDSAAGPSETKAEIVKPDERREGSGDQESEQKIASAAVVAPATPAKSIDLPARDLSPQALASLQAANSSTVAVLVKELDPQAHFVSYATPSFVAFRKGAYLEMSINTVLKESAAGSRYRLAALAFDEHIAHLIRPVLGYLKDDQQFDGIGFSTNIHTSTKGTSATSSLAVEFFFPFSALRCYESYDCTGQQLIDSGTVLINGERAALNLQSAEASAAQ